MDSSHALITQVSDKISDIAQSDVVIGEPIELGEITIVPLSRVSIGFGGGGGTAEGEGPRRKGQRGGRGRGGGGASGGGGKVRPVGVIVFGPDGVEVQPIPDKKGLMDTLFDKVPGLIEKIRDLFEDDDDFAEAETEAGVSA